MIDVYSNKDFESLTLEEIKTWIALSSKTLIGSAIFTKNNSLVSKTVCWAERCKDKEECFVPSHTGSIIKYQGEIMLFDMKPLRAKVQPLADYLLKTTDEYTLILRNFNLNVEMFSANIAEHIGEFYPYFSAIRSAFTKRETKWRRHCSELHLRELQKQGILMNLNPEITPDELYHELMCGWGK